MLIDLHVGVPRWKELWTVMRKRRIRGVWDAALERETIVLNDGRKLSYFLDGKPNILQRNESSTSLNNSNTIEMTNLRRKESDDTATKANIPYIFCFHAMFLSGNSYIMTRPPKDYILVCVNRPGYFGSDPPVNDSYDYHSFANDMSQLADHLGIDNFYVAGHSSGGPCALACAACLPNRVKAVGILSGDPEYAHDGVPDKRWINAICLGSVLPFMLKYVLFCLPLARGARRGLINDYRLETSIYSFRTEHVYQPTIVYVGEDDNVMPLEVSRHVHERLENARHQIIPKIGHLGLLRDEVLQDFFAALIALPAGRTFKTAEQEIEEKSEMTMSPPHQVV